MPTNSVMNFCEVESINILAQYHITRWSVIKNFNDFAAVIGVDLRRNQNIKDLFEMVEILSNQLVNETNISQIPVYFWTNLDKLICEKKEYAVLGCQLVKLLFWLIDAYKEVLPCCDFSFMLSDDVCIFLKNFDCKVTLKKNVKYVFNIGQSGISSTKNVIKEISPQDGFYLLPVSASDGVVLATERSDYLHSPPGEWQVEMQKNKVYKITDDINNALTFMRNNHPESYSLVHSITKWYVPLVSGGEVHYSSTSELTPGMIYTAELGCPVRMSEVLIHENAHNQLNLILKEKTIFSSKEWESYIVYSPWRNDPRPLHGLFHAIFVFYYVINFYLDVYRQKTYELVNITEKRIAYLLDLKVSQLLLGIEQIPENSLDTLGIKIVSAIKNNAHQIKDAVKCRVPRAIQDHVSTFVINNTETLVNIV